MKASSAARRWLPIAAGVGAVAIAGATARGRGRDLDRRLYRVLDRPARPVVDRCFEAITELGSIWASGAAAAVMAGRGRGREGLDALGAAGAMWAIGQLLKKAVRPRPYDALTEVRLRIDRPRGTSWPSSHPAVLLAFVSVASRDVGASRLVRGGLAALAGAVGVSRVALGVHYPADVAGGLLLGGGLAGLWSGAVSPRIVGSPPSLGMAGTVTR